MNILEPLVRANLSKWQAVYDVFPSPARSLLASARGWLLTQVRYAPETFKFLEELRALECWSADDISAHQNQALHAIVEHAQQTVPYYANYPRSEVRHPRDLARLPILAR